MTLPDAEALAAAADLKAMGEWLRDAMTDAGGIPGWRAMTETEAEVLGWLTIAPGGFKSSVAGVQECLQNLCRAGLAKSRFVHGEFYYQITERGANAASQPTPRPIEPLAASDSSASSNMEGAKP